MILAEQVEGRTIHIIVDVRLSPPKGQILGSTDAAGQIGKGLINEAVMLLKAAGEAEGFTVKIEAEQVIV